jgi:ABC-2 type transport system permease protein
VSPRPWLEARREPWATNLRAAWGRAYIRIFAASREPSWILFETVMPVLGMFAYVFVYRALGAPREFEAFVVLGGVMMAYWLAVLWSMGTQWYWEKQEGNLEIYLVAPCSRLAILAGMALGGIVMTSMRAVLSLVLGLLLFRVDVMPDQPWAALGVFLLTLGALYALGMCLASLFLMYGREVMHVANALQEPMYLVNGLYFPIRALGPWAFAAVSTLPLALGLDAMRQLVLGPGLARGLWPVPLEAAVLGAALVVNLAAAVALLARLEHEGKKSGALVLRHQ